MKNVKNVMNELKTILEQFDYDHAHECDEYFYYDEIGEVAHYFVAFNGGRPFCNGALIEIKANGYTVELDTCKATLSCGANVLSYTDNGLNRYITTDVFCEMLDDWR